MPPEDELQGRGGAISGQGKGVRNQDIATLPSPPDSPAMVPFQVSNSKVGKTDVFKKMLQEAERKSVGAFYKLAFDP